MDISLIAAIGTNGQLGQAGGMPWRLKNDFKKFKSVTMGHHLIMGRKTYESIGRPLPGRTSVVVTRNKDYQIDPGHFVVSSIDEAIKLCEIRGDDECFICGGGEIYRQSIELCDRLYISEVDFGGEADTYFPQIPDSFEAVSTEGPFPANEEDQYSWKFSLLEKRK